MDIIKLAIVDDHTLFRNAIASFLNGFDHFEVVCEAESTTEFFEKFNTLTRRKQPQMVLMDISIPGDDGIRGTAKIKQDHPAIKVLMLTMLDEKESILKAVKAGADGYLLKNARPAELESAIITVAKGNKFYDTRVTENIFKLLTDDKLKEETIDEKRRTWEMLTEKERKFAEWACTELTYTDIAKEMNVSITTVEGWRQTVFTKFGVKTRVGLALIVERNNFLK
ncbi:MAG TPA: response regulator transcription factor [Chitinophagaceae bacterium]|jgi:DNA-binding NarL/FixJ family response regulator|nr:response regulator transcription factor [Chitinophagaceae bacterium]